MQNPPKIFCLIVVLTIFPFAWSCAGSERQKLRQIRAAEGLPSSFVYSLFRDEEGFYALQADSLRELAMIPQVVITRILVRNVPLKADSLAWARKYLRLKYHQNYLTFEFVAPGHLHPTKKQYICFLEGLDHDWHYTGSRTFASYTGLPSGDYIFRVKGLNDHGRLDEAGASLAITILPPPWKTWWAFVLYVLFLLSLFLAWRLYDLKRLRLKRELTLEHLEAEKLKELDGIKSRFFTNITHEFRTPLTLILGQIERLRATIREGEAAADLDMMHRSARRLHSLINQLLSLSKLESGQMHLHACKENIVLLVNECLQSFESLARKKGIDVVFHPTDEPIMLYIDRDKVEKIFFNLLSNAFKFTRKGGRVEVDVGVRALHVPDGEMMACITITDTGCGIPAGQLPHIFDRFYQADNDPEIEKEGTGIGLALVKELVELHHGTITVDSTLGVGTTFSLFFPMGCRHLAPDQITEDHEFAAVNVTSGEPAPDSLPAGEEPVTEDSSDMAEACFKEDKPLILVLEDNADLRIYIRRILEVDHYVMEANNGEEGFDIAREKIPDLIVSDVMMPNMDGYEFCRKVKADEHTCHIPVILLTAKADLEDKLEGLETGADDFLTKPFNHQELNVRIRNLIQQRERVKEQYKHRFFMTGCGDQEDRASFDDQCVQKAIQYVCENLSDPALNVDKLCRRMAMSHSQLYRKLKALTDHSPNEMIRSLRLQRAAELLARHTGNISEIAYEVGFNNPSYFSECFRRRFGCPPSEYGGD